MPKFTITRTHEIECSHKALLIAKAIHAYNNYPGRPAEAAVWPPNTNSALVKYVEMGKFVEATLAQSGQ